MGRPVGRAYPVEGQPVGPLGVGLVEWLPDAVVLRRADGIILSANRAFARLLPDRLEVVGSTLRPAIVAAGRASVRADGVREIDEATDTPAGIRWFAWAETDIVLPEGGAAALRCGRDITERVTTERALDEARTRAEAASESKSRFLATVSHEFRTPLNGILGMASLLLETPLDAEQATYVQAVHSSAEAFLSLIEEVLDFSKIEAGRIDLANEPFEIEALVQGVVELLAPRAQGKGVEISGFVAPSVPRLVLGDRDRLRQVLFNLAGNAVKFTEAGGVGLSVEWEPASATLVFAVEDTGPGIAPDRLDLVFQEFEQEATPSRNSGTGLGLAITRRIVQHMGGVVGVESALGHGSRFEVRLALPTVEGAALARNPVPAIAGTKVLLLAPSPFQAGFLTRMLGAAGGEVTRAETLDEALVALGRVPDVLIADCAIGEAAVRAVAAEAGRRGIGRTIVLLSPFERRDLGSPHAAGFDAYLVKPVRSRSLWEQLRSGRNLARIAEAPAAFRAPILRRQPLRVLLAEDNDVNALLAMKALEKLGAFVDWAKDGLEALALAEAALARTRPPYDLMLMDVRMPGLDGLSVTRRIREGERAGGHPACRIVALTASVLRGDETFGRTAGFDAFLTKPFTYDALAAQLPPEEGGLAQTG